MNVLETRRLWKSKISHMKCSIEFNLILVFSSENNKENSPRNNKKFSHELSADTIVSETSVQRARAELVVLDQERAKLEKKRQIQLKEFETAKSDARRLFEVCLPIESNSSIFTRM